MDKPSCSYLRARSGGDALKQQELPKDVWYAKNEATRVKIDKHGVGQTGWIDEISACPVYHPSKDEFSDPLEYLQNIAPDASKFGICKVVSPIVASVPAGVVLTRELTNFKFTTRVQPMRLANWDLDDKITFPMSGRNYNLREFEKMANKTFDRKFSSGGSLPSNFIEMEYWKELVTGKLHCVEYACDIDGSAFSASSEDPLGQSSWNLKGFSQLPKSTLRLLETAIPGVTDPMLYVGMLFSTFAWHVEDHYLYSINYHHFGAPKTWYGVPGYAALDFEEVVKDHIYDSEMLKSMRIGAVQDLLLGKTTMFPPKLLCEHGVPVFRAVQHPGEFVITFPRAYHAGFSHGFNCGEAVNFAMANWFPYGMAACLRYEFLNRAPLLPHEELLCKKAIILYHSGKKDNSFEDQRCVKVAFLWLMMQQVYIRDLLRQKGAQIVNSDAATVLCGHCKHACYVSHVICKCHPVPICFNHEEIKSCTCGNERTVYVKDNFRDLEVAAQKFAKEKGIVDDMLSSPIASDPLSLDVWPITEFSTLLRTDEYNFFTTDNQQETSFLTSSNTSCGENELPRVLTSQLDFSAPLGSVVSSCTLPFMVKQHDQESDIEEEAFRVKRRRVLPAGSRRFQVDEQGLTPGRPQMDASDAKMKSLSVSKCDSHIEKVVGNVQKAVGSGDIDSAIPDDGHQVLVRDIICELSLKGSPTEVIKQWQRDAKCRGITLKVRDIMLAGKSFEALCFEDCMLLKELLPREAGPKLEKLMFQCLFRNKKSKAWLDCKSADSDTERSLEVNHLRILPLMAKTKYMDGSHGSWLPIKRQKWQHGLQADCLSSCKVAGKSTYEDEGTKVKSSGASSLSKATLKMHSSESDMDSLGGKPDLRKNQLTMVEHTLLCQSSVNKDERTGNNAKTETITVDGTKQALLCNTFERQNMSPLISEKNIDSQFSNANMSRSDGEDEGMKLKTFGKPSLSNDLLEMHSNESDMEFIGGKPVLKKNQLRVVEHSFLGKSSLSSKGGRTGNTAETETSKVDGTKQGSLCKIIERQSASPSIEKTMDSQFNNRSRFEGLETIAVDASVYRSCKIQNHTQQSLGGVPKEVGHHKANAEAAWCFKQGENSFAAHTGGKLSSGEYMFSNESSGITGCAEKSLENSNSLLCKSGEGQHRVHSNHGSCIASQGHQERVVPSPNSEHACKSWKDIYNLQRTCFSSSAGLSTRWKCNLNCAPRSFFSRIGNNDGGFATKSWKERRNELTFHSVATARPEGDRQIRWRKATFPHTTGRFSNARAGHCEQGPNYQRSRCFKGYHWYRHSRKDANWNERFGQLSAPVQVRGFENQRATVPCASARNEKLLNKGSMKSFGCKFGNSLSDEAYDPSDWGVDLTHKSPTMLCHLNPSSL